MTQRTKIPYPMSIEKLVAELPKHSTTDSTLLNDLQKSIEIYSQPTGSREVKMNASSKDTGNVNIKGKSYRTVAARVGDLREVHADWAISTEIYAVDDQVVIMKATILNEQGRIIGVGHAEERRASSQINKTSALENCETSAIGRALAACGYGGTEYASANEVQNAIHQQETKTFSRQAMEGIYIDWKSLGDPEIVMRGALTKFSTEQIDAAEAAMLINDAIMDLDGDIKIELWKRFNASERNAMKRILEK